MNRCVLIGNLTRDPELKTTTSGLSVCNFTIAVSRSFSSQGGEREADFIPVVVWRKQAENAAKYVRKGSQVCVAGAIQTRSYEVDGSRRYITEIVANEVQFLGRTGDGAKQEKNRGNGIPFTQEELEDEDMPF